MTRSIRTTSLILFFMTLLWVILMILSTASIEPGWSPEDYVQWVSEPTLLFRLNYIHVSLLTIGVVILFMFLFRHLRPRSKTIATLSLVFVPAYGLLNLFCYASQIHLVPSMAESALGNPDALREASRWIQAYPASTAGFLNGLAYALLAIPSIGYGTLLMQEKRKLSGFTLFLNGICCLLGILGMIIGNAILSLGILVGGFIFLISMGGLWFDFRSS